MSDRGEQQQPRDAIVLLDDDDLEEYPIPHLALPQSIPHSLQQLDPAELAAVLANQAPRVDPAVWNDSDASSLGSSATASRMRTVQVQAAGDTMDTELLNLQMHLDLLTQAKAKTLHSKGTERDQDPPDPIDLLLANGLRGLLRKVVMLQGSEPQLEILVSFKDVSFSAEVPESTNAIPSIGTIMWQALQFWHRPKTIQKYVLHDITGSFRPGITTLVLGPPRSGKSSILKLVAGRLQESRHTKLQGDVQLAGRSVFKMLKQKGGVQLTKLVGYIPQVDEHIPTLTTRETINFAHTCTSRLIPERFAEQEEQQVRERQLMNGLAAEITMAMLGIRHAGDTVVGNEKLRGISGGQRKRLTAGEILITGTPVMLADEISTGLDSSTTFDICSALKASARYLRTTVVISLLQPGPETYETFDEVLVMAAGHIAYQGPRDMVLSYFKSLGFVCPPAKEAAEFLQEVTTSRGIEKFRITGAAREIQRPEDFGPAWQRSTLFQQRMKEDAELYVQSKSQLDALSATDGLLQLLTRSYTRPLWASIALCTKRQVILTGRNKQATTGRMAQSVIVGTIVGSLFFQLPIEEFNSKFAVMFFSQMFIGMGGMALLPAILEERRVIYRQMEAHFFPPLAYSIAVNVVEIPVSFMETLIFCCIVYWMAGFSPAGADFMTFTLIIFLVKIFMGAYCRLLAMVSPNNVVAQGAAAVSLLVLVMHAGFFLAKGDVRDWWIWAYWANPLQYGMTALALVEFHSAQYSQLLNAADPSLGTLGDYFLRLKKMPTDAEWLPWSLVCIAGGYVFLVVVSSLVLSFVRWPDSFPPEPPAPTEGIVVEAARPIPFTPCTLTWQDICYDVDIPGKKGHSAKYGLRLLNNVTGHCKPKTMVALMGSSGAGKTTLLDVLAGRKNSGRITGSILLNGQEVDPTTFSRFAGYVEQQDIHSPSCTVLEAIQFSAALRLPRVLTKEEKEAHVIQVISILNMQSIAHTVVGTRVNGLSVEQLKRLTIGVEMAANPAILFLDEPTSGLDSLAADMVMDALKAVTETGRTLLCTIHQPSSYLFSMFQHLLLLTRGGKTVFFGETGEGSAKLINYFNRIPGVPQHDGSQNPATWMLNVLATDGIDFPEVYLSSDLCNANTQEVATLGNISNGKPLQAGLQYQSTSWEQMTLLLRKWGRMHWRTPSYNLSRTFTCMVVALVIGSIFFQIDSKDQQGMFTAVGLQFMGFVFLGVLFANTMQTVIATERTVYYREKAAHMYHPVVLDLVVGGCELPYVTVNAIFFSVIFYFMVGLNSDLSTMLFWFLTFWLYTLYSTYLGLLMGCLMPDSEQATAILGALTSISSLLCGFMLPRDSIPWWWRWLHYINPLTYAIQPAVGSQLFCAAADLNPLQPSDCPVFPIQTQDGTTQIVPVWTFVKEAFDLDYSMRWWDVLILCCFIAVVRVGTWLALAYVNHAKR